MCKFLASSEVVGKIIEEKQTELIAFGKWSKSLFMFALLTDQKEPLIAVPWKVKIVVPKKSTRSLKNTCDEGHFLGKVQAEGRIFQAVC